MMAKTNGDNTVDNNGDNKRTPTRDDIEIMTMMETRTNIETGHNDGDKKWRQWMMVDNNGNDDYNGDNNKDIDI